MKHKLRLGIIIGVEFLVIAIILVLIFFAGKKSYTVTFDLDGGTLLSGDLVQEVVQGGNATPPSAVKDGCYLHSWSASYNQITKDVTIRAIWEYQTTVGIKYKTIADANYCLIESVYPDLQGEVYVGSFYNGKRVLGVMDGAFKNCKDITKIYMLDGIVTIGENAFAGCTSLEEIVLPRTLVNLRKNAFSGCSSLKEINMPSTLKVIEDNAFANCTSLTSIKMSPSLESVGNGAFKNCTSIKTVETSVVLKTIGDSAFMNCTALESVELYPALRSIGKNAFSDCASLKNIVLPEGLLQINGGAFSGCSTLEKIVIPSTVETIGDNVFNSSSNKIYAYCSKENKPIGWKNFMVDPNSDAHMFWGYVAPPVIESPAESGAAEEK